MSSPNLNVALVLKLVDRLTGPARAATQALRGIGQAAQQAGRRNVEWANQQIEKNRARQTAIYGEVAATAAMGAALLASVNPAVKFEAAMADVSKVIDFKAPVGFQQLQTDILALTSSGGLPMAADKIAEIIAEAGQSNIVDALLPDDEKRKQLLEFATIAAKMGVAFDMSAEDSAQTMVNWRNALKLSQQEAINLGDTVNHLSNNMAANAENTTFIIREQGAAALAAGLKIHEIAGLSAALLAGGAKRTIGATALKNLVGSLSMGEAMTERERGAMGTLGFDPEYMARRMQTDAKGAIIDVMTAMSELPQYQQSAVLSQLFGEESKGAIAPLLTNLELLHQAFDLAADKQGAAGSMLQEYNRISETTANNQKLTIQSLINMATVIGTVVLPEYNELLDRVQSIAQATMDWAAANPELVKWIYRIVGGFVLLKGATLAVKFALYLFIHPILLFWRWGAQLLILIPKIAGWLVWLAAGPIKFLIVNFVRLLILIPKIAGGLLWLAGGAIKFLIGAFVRLGVAMMANPIGLIVAGIAALAYVIYDNWDNIVGYFSEKIARIKAAFETGLLNGVFKALSELNPFRLMLDSAQGLIAYVMELVGIPNDIVSAFREFDLFETGQNLLQRLWDGAASIIPKMIASIGDKLSGLIPDWMKKAWDWVSSGAAALSNSAANASDLEIPGLYRGGPALAGHPYIIGERGPELFVPSISGRVLPNNVLKGALAASALALPVAAQTTQDLNFDTRPAIAAPTSGQVIRYGDQITINITPHQGMDARDVAREVKRVLDARENDRRGDLHDGVDY